MQAVLFHAPRQIAFRDDVALPDPGPGEVVVRVRSALTCGTDLKGYKRGHRLFKPGMGMGHEWAGEISAVGAGVLRWKEGDAVTAGNSAPCNSCFYCRRGQQQLCEDLDNRFNWGTWAEYLRVPAHIVAQNMHPVPPSLSFDHAPIVEPLACAIHGALVGDIALGDTVLIIGAGAQSLMQIQIAKSLGASKVIVIGRSRGRLARAAQLGADVTLSVLDGDPRQAVLDLTGGRGADVALESAGTVETWQQAFDLTRPCGTAVMFSGLPGGTQVTYDATKLHYSQITVKGIFHHTPKLIEMAMAMLVNGQIDGAQLVDDVMPLAQAEQALMRMDRSEVVKVALRP
jgi:L-iditol 2-dehydrogenase